MTHLLVRNVALFCILLACTHRCTYIEASQLSTDELVKKECKKFDCARFTRFETSENITSDALITLIKEKTHIFDETLHTLDLSNSNGVELKTPLVDAICNCKNFQKLHRIDISNQKDAKAIDEFLVKISKSKVGCATNIKAFNGKYDRFSSTIWVILDKKICEKLINEDKCYDNKKCTIISEGKEVRGAKVIELSSF